MIFTYDRCAFTWLSSVGLRSFVLYEWGIEAKDRSVASALREDAPVLERN